MGSAAKDLEIIIVGGGIAGLASAIALRSPGRNITILERSRMLKETGALISLQPNASKIVSSWDVDRFLAPFGPMIDEGFRLFDRKGNLVREIQLDFSRFGADRVLYHRQDLHTGLKNAALSEDLPGNPVKIRVATAVTECDPESGSVTTDSGERIQADIVIAADGIRSAIRKKVAGNAQQPKPTGISAYRMLIPIESLQGIGIPEDTLNLTTPVTTMIVGQDRRVIMGPGRKGTVFGVVALVPDTQMHETAVTDSWVGVGSVEAVLKAYEDFPDWLLKIFAKAPEHALWQLRDIDPVPDWVQGRTILVGDAAHAMLPTQGQGASQAVEDAEALSAYLSELSDSPTKEDINIALMSAFKARAERASLIQTYSREQAKQGTDDKTNQVKLDPAQFMKYNCQYSGAKDWVARSKAEGSAV